MEETISIKKSNAALAHKKAGPKMRAILEVLFGKEIVSQKKIEDMDLEDILEVAKPSAEVLAIIRYTGDDETMQGLSALAAIEQITKVYNEGKAIDWTDSSQYKYFVWVEMATASGAGFSSSSYDDWITFSYCGSRLAFLSKDRCLLAKDKFGYLYAKLFCIRNQVPNIYSK